MKHFTIDGQTFKALPDPCHNCSPMTEALFLELGGTITDDGNPTPEEEFEAACELFRAVCAAIGQFIDDPDFHGGFGEMAVFANSEAYQANPVMGNSLAIQWSAANEQCKYFGSKIGLGQPAWWYRCWALVGIEIY